MDSSTNKNGNDYYNYKTNSFYNTSTYKGNLSRAKTILQLSQQAKNVVTYGAYSETLLASGGELTINKYGTVSKFGSSDGWFCNVSSVDCSNNHKATKEYLKYMEQWGVLDMVRDLD